MSERKKVILSYLKEKKVPIEKIKKYRSKFGKSIYFKQDVDKIFKIKD